jgi:predicted Zn-dependent protease
MSQRCLFLAFPMLVLCVGCNAVSGTGRSQFNTYSVDDEITLGSQAYSEMIQNEDLQRSGPDVEMVKRVTTRIARAARERHPEIAGRFDWEVVLIEDDDVANAWALPGGKMAVYSGILPFTQTEDGLAVVMGHEAAHAIARHGGENMSRAGVLSVISAGTSVALDGEYDQHIAVAGAAYGLLGEPAFSRQQESEADEIGLFITAQAGYDPRMAITLWQRMAEKGGGPPEFLSTHPSEETRISRLKAVMPRAMLLYRQNMKQAGNN